MRLGFLRLCGVKSSACAVTRRSTCLRSVVTVPTDSPPTTSAPAPTEASPEPSLRDISKGLASLTAMVAGLATKADLARLSVKVDKLILRVGGSIELSARAQLVREFGASFAESIVLRTVLDLVHACTGQGCVLPAERALHFVDKQLTRVDKDELDRVRAVAVANMLVSLHPTLVNACMHLERLIATMKDAGKETRSLEALHASTVSTADRWGEAIRRSSSDGCDFVSSHPNLAVVVLTAATSDWATRSQEEKAPFQTEIEVDAVGRTRQTQLVDGEVVQLCIEAGEIKSIDDGQKAVKQLSILFAVLERVICAVSAGKDATWKNGVYALPATWSQQSRIAAADDVGGVAYAFLGRVATCSPLEVKYEWTLPESTGVHFLRPDQVQFVSTSVT